MKTAEGARKVILIGWLLATIGVAGSVYAMLRAGDGVGIVAALRAGGIVGWLSAALLAAGVAAWLAGNLALMRAPAAEDARLDR
jgi:hypothetical protein